MSQSRHRDNVFDIGGLRCAALRRSAAYPPTGLWFQGVVPVARLVHTIRGTDQSL